MFGAGGAQGRCGVGGDRALAEAGGGVGGKAPERLLLVIKGWFGRHAQGGTGLLGPVPGERHQRVRPGAVRAPVESGIGGCGTVVQET